MNKLNSIHSSAVRSEVGSEELESYSVVSSTQKKMFTHEGLSAHAHNNIIVEVHRWLLSVAVKKTILCCSFFTLVANK